MNRQQPLQLKRGIDIIPTQGRVPPQAIDVEQQVIGAMLLEKEAIDMVTSVLEADNFHADYHRKIFQAIISLHEKQETADLITVAEELRKKGHLEIVGGEVYLAALTMKVTSAANVEEHAKIVCEKALMRGLIISCSAIAARAYSPAEDTFELIDEAQLVVGAISEKRFKGGKKAIGTQDLMHNVLDRLEILSQRGELITGVRSGLHDVDALTAGWQDTDLIIIAGVTSSGKTAFALASALGSGVPTGIFSAEMSELRIGLRLLSMQSKVDSYKLRTGKLDNIEWHKAANAAAEIAKKQIWIDDTASPSIKYIRSAARRLHKEKGVRLIIVDYLQLCKGDEHAETREREIASISSGLKALAKELSIPVITLSQLNRKSVGRDDKRPMLADLRESGAIEMDADVVCFVHRPEMYAEKESTEFYEWSNKAEIIIAKQRDGPLDTVTVQFQKRFTLFRDLNAVGTPEQEQLGF